MLLQKADRDELVFEHLERADSVARQVAALYNNPDCSDVFGAVLQALEGSASRYDGEKAGFWTFACKRVRWAAFDAIRKGSMAREPVDGLAHRDSPPVFFSSAFDGLTENERQVLCERYLQGMSNQAIGEALGVTDSRVSQIHRLATAKIRQNIERCYRRIRVVAYQLMKARCVPHTRSNSPS